MCAGQCGNMPWEHASCCSFVRMHWMKGSGNAHVLHACMHITAAAAERLRLDTLMPFSCASQRCSKAQQHVNLLPLPRLPLAIVLSAVSILALALAALQAIHPLPSILEQVPLQDSGSRGRAQHARVVHSKVNTACRLQAGVRSSSTAHRCSAQDKWHTISAADQLAHLIQHSVAVPLIVAPATAVLAAAIGCRSQQQQTLVSIPISAACITGRHLTKAPSEAANEMQACTLENSTCSHLPQSGP